MCLLVLLIVETSGEDNQTYTDVEARGKLAKGKIIVKKPYPSLENIPRNVVDYLLKLTSISKCPIIIKGYSETMKVMTVPAENHRVQLRINLDDCINNYIKRKFTKIKTENKKRVSFMDDDGDIYTIDSSSWLIDPA